MKRIKTMIVAIFTTLTTFAQSNITIDASLAHDVLGNVSGGIKQGVSVLDYGTLGFSFNTESAELWNGGKLYINTAFTAGGNPSANLIGDLQIVDNIEAGNHFYMQELWYKQNITDNISITFGLQDYNAEFMSREESGLYINSTFGTNNVIAGNVAPPHFSIISIRITNKFQCFGELFNASCCI
jgi:porin